MTWRAPVHCMVEVWWMTRRALVQYVMDDVASTGALYGAGRKAGASSYTRKRLSLSVVDDVTSTGMWWMTRRGQVHCVVDILAGTGTPCGG